MTRFPVFALLILAPACAAAQTLTLHTPVNPPFDAATYKPLEARERWSRWWKDDGGSPAMHVNVLMLSGIGEASE